MSNWRQHTKYKVLNFIEYRDRRENISALAEIIV